MTDPNPKPPAEYEFAVRFRNDRMGFRKNLSVQAPHARAAIAAGEAQLREKNYNPAEFEATEVIRGREVGT